MTEAASISGLPIPPQGRLVDFSAHGEWATGWGKGVGVCPRCRTAGLDCEAAPLGPARQPL